MCSLVDGRRFNKDCAESEMEEVVRVLSTFEGEGRKTEITEGVKRVTKVAVENLRLIKTGYGKFLKICQKYSK